MVMRDYETDSVAVVDPSPHIIGGVLLSDVFPVIISRHELHGTVASHMTRDVTIASPTDTIQKIYTMIMESGFSAFPVVKKKTDCRNNFPSRSDPDTAGAVGNCPACPHNH